MFELSYNTAIRIQTVQLYWERKLLGRVGTKKIRSMTKPCPPDVPPDTPISIFLINKLVPRGGSIETWYRNPRFKDQHVYESDVEMSQYNVLRGK